VKLTLADTRYLKDSIGVISELVNEARFRVTPTAIELVAMDPANVAMVIFKLLSSAFTEFHVEKDVELSVNLANFKQILRRAKPSDILGLELEENKLKITLKGANSRTFFLPLIDLEDRDQKIPNLEFPVTIKTNASVISEAIEDVDVVAESVSFIAEPKKFTVMAEGDLNKAHIEIKSDDVTRITTTSPDKIKAKYSIEYLKKMVSGSKVSDEVTIQFNKDYPLKLEFKEMDKLLLAFILAPRVEND
jgi:proliferating cell nuclear antigen